ncbi:MAG: hypothetical protein K2X27_01625, partial [Candidatus Obscuribacterales bacterium]|nr:hypothetical protein [Candidatus Obscuribacterales bacterium]
PRKPETPMHDELDRRTANLEKKLVEQVKSSMSVSDQRRLEKQMSEYQKAFKEASSIGNPWGTGEGFKPLPKPGNAIRDYYDRVAEATEAYMKY